MSWQSTRIAEFNATAAMFGNLTLTFNGLSCICYATPLQATKVMIQTAFVEKRVSTFSVLMSEFTRLGLEVKSVFQFNERNYIIESLSDDIADATMDFKAGLKL